MNTEFLKKKRRVSGFLGRVGADAVLLSKQNNFAWMTCGGDNHVATATESGSCTLLVASDSVHVIADNIETPRLRDEETVRVGVSHHQFDWHGGSRTEIIKGLAGGKTVVSDDGFEGTRNVEAEFAALRFSLLPEELKRYRKLAGACSAAVEEVCRKAKRGETEHRVAGRLSDIVLSAGITPAVVLIAADERISKYRHPIPTDKKIRKQCMVVLCGRKWGLIVSLTRLFHFGKMPRELEEKHKAVTQIDAELIAGTSPGRKVRDIFAEGVKAYAEAGHPREWKLHHQGGATGYGARDYKGTLSSREIVQPNQAFAWNPSITGTKSEDTIIALGDRTEIISKASCRWPMLKCRAGGKTIPRPAILVR